MKCEIGFAETNSAFEIGYIDVSKPTNVMHGNFTAHGNLNVKH